MSESCEVPLENASPDEVRAILREARTVAVVGLSDKPDRDSYHVAEYLQRAGYRVIPINPAVSGVLGEKAYPSLRDVPERIDVVDVFRKSEAVPVIVEEAIAVGAKVVWLQEGIVHNAAAERARAAGLKVVMSRCMLKEHARLR
jgi:predicted CoA-binding protein